MIAALKYPVGAMTERITIQRNDAETLTVSSITRSGTTATATTAKEHGYATGDFVTIAGADQSAYNGKVKITVTSTTTFTYTVAGSPATPATNAITATYASDAQGGRAIPWRNLATVPAELVPLRASERLQSAAVQTPTDYRFRVRVRSDLTPRQRISWTPRWPPGRSAKTLQIHGVQPVEHGLEYVHLDCGEVA